MNKTLNDTSEISLNEILNIIKDFFKLLGKNLLRILFVSLLGGIIGGVYAWIQPVNYTAKITFVVEEAKSGGSSMGGLASLAGQFGLDLNGSTGGGVFSGDNILLYFKSESLSKEVLLSRINDSTNQSIADFYSEVYNLKSNWKKNKNIGNLSFPPDNIKKSFSRVQDSLLQKIIQNILENSLVVSKADKKSSFIDITVNMRDERLAKIYCERLVHVAVERYVSIKTLRQKTTVDKLQKRVDSIANLLQSKTYASANIQTNSSVMDINPLYKTSTNVAYETNFRDKSMLTTIFASVAQNLEIAKFSLSQETPVIQIVDNASYPLKKEKKSRLLYSIASSLIFGLIYIIFILAKKIAASKE